MGGDLAEVRAVVPPQGGPHPQPPVVGPLEGHRVARVQTERVPAHGEDVETGSVAAEPRDLQRQRAKDSNDNSDSRTDRQTDRQTDRRRSLLPSSALRDLLVAFSRVARAPLLLLFLLLSVCLPGSQYLFNPSSRSACRQIKALPPGDELPASQK